MDNEDLEGQWWAEVGCHQQLLREYEEWLENAIIPLDFETWQEQKYHKKWRAAWKAWADKENK